MVNKYFSVVPGTGLSRGSWQAPTVEGATGRARDYQKSKSDSNAQNGSFAGLQGCASGNRGSPISGYAALASRRLRLGGWDWVFDDFSGGFVPRWVWVVFGWTTTPRVLDYAQIAIFAEMALAKRAKSNGVPPLWDPKGQETGAGVRQRGPRPRLVQPAACHDASSLRP